MAGSLVPGEETEESDKLMESGTGRMSGKRTVVLIHGVGGAEARKQWLEPLNTMLMQRRYPRIDANSDNIIEPLYEAQLKLQSATSLPPVTWKRPDDRVYLPGQLDYAAASEALAAALAEVPRGSTSALTGTPEDLAQAAADFAINLWPGVREYRNSEKTRASVLQAVLRALPKKGNIVLVGYSLGSVVAHDLLRRLPAALTVDLLLTVASPLAINKFGDGHLKDEFPYDRVRAWVNLYDPSDPVTLGHGAAQRYPDALDLQVGCNTHDIAGYASHPGFAAAVGHATFGPARTGDGKAVARRTVVGKNFDQAWYPTLLQNAYCTSVSTTFAQDQWRGKMRFDEAHKIAASRVLRQVDQALDRADLGGSQSTALRGAPTLDDLLVHGHEHITAQRSADELLPFLVALCAASPVAPFDVDLSEAHRKRALERLLGSARLAKGDEPSDSEVAQAVLQAVKEGHEVVKPESSGGGGGWLVLLGVGLLAATGIGLVAAVPAGLAGAAALTSTLAAFGPGGMVGGMVTLAALTGASTAFVGGGVAAPGHKDGRVDRSSTIVTAAEALAAEPLDALRSTLGALLTVTEAQRRLKLTVSYSDVLALLNRTNDLVVAERSLHQRLVPDRPSTKVWGEKQKVIKRAIDWMLSRDWPAEIRPPALT